MGTMLAGSPGFQSRNESDIGLPSDIYAYGAVLNCALWPVWPGLLPYQITYKVAVDKENPNIGHLRVSRIYATNDSVTFLIAQQQT